MQKNKIAFISNTLSDVFYHLSSVSGVQLLAGCTQIDKIADKSVSLRTVPELTAIEKRELYAQFGSAVPLSRLIALGDQKLPKVLLDALKTIATPQVRNVATLGGNICAKEVKGTLWAPLLALNAKLEIKTPNETLYVPFSKFDGIKEKQVLVNVRVPLEEWEIEVFHRLGPSKTRNDYSAGFVFLAKTQRGVISAIRIVLAGSVLFFSPEFENRIVGTKLPLPEKTLLSLINDAKKLFAVQNRKIDYEVILRAQFLNLLRNSFEQLM